MIHPENYRYVKSKNKIINMLPRINIILLFSMNFHASFLCSRLILNLITTALKTMDKETHYWQLLPVHDLGQQISYLCPM